MTLKEKLAADLQKAMKSGDRTRIETIRTVRAALLEKEKERGAETNLSPEVELGVLTAAAKKRRESIEMFEKGGREDLVDQEKNELAIIQEYLPKQLSEDELMETIRSVITEAGAASESDFGKVMPAVMKLVKGRADGRRVQEMVKKLLASP
jgi:uncharacterized protein YqeY